MKEIWCWRCKILVPMLEDEEWLEMHKVLLEGLENIKNKRRETGVELKDLTIQERHHSFNKALSLYEEITGFKEENPDAIWHHRVSIYGPPCDNCGKPFRTPKAKFCAACGHTHIA